jgi:hypothetical protein
MPAVSPAVNGKRFRVWPTAASRREYSNAIGDPACIELFQFGTSRPQGAAALQHLI